MSQNKTNLANALWAIRQKMGGPVRTLWCVCHELLLVANMRTSCVQESMLDEQTKAMTVWTFHL